MRLLVITPQLPYPPHQGTSLRNFHIIQGLSRRHEITLLSYLDPGQSRDELGPLPGLCRRVETVPAPVRSRRQRLHGLVASRQPDMALRLESEAMAQKLDRMLRAQHFDVVQVEGIELAHLLPMVRVVSPASRVLFDDHNAEAALQRLAFRTDLGSPRRWPLALYSLAQAERLRRYEAWACRQADWVTAVSDNDAEALAALSGRPVTAIPNCIDVGDYRPVVGLRPWDYDLVFTGKMDYRPNVDGVLWFGQRIWPLIKQNRPEATWAVVGQKPHPRLESLHGLPGVTVTGRVDAIQPYLDGAKVYVLPLRMGSGTRLKLLEAMAAGRAIVSTPLGAAGYPVVENEHLLLADVPSAFALAVLHLLRQPADRQRLGRAAQVFAQQYDWRAVIPRFDAVYASEPFQA